MLLRSAEVVFFFVLTTVLNAGNPLYSRLGAGEAGMAYACVASTGHWCSFHNQAALPYNKSFSIGTSFESRFMMTEMSSKSITCILPGRPAPLGLMMIHYGNSQYSLIMGGLGSGVVLTQGLSLGVQVDVISEHCAGNYEDLVHVTFETGILGQISPEVTFGFHIFNPLAQLNGLPSSIRTGITWSPDKSLSASLETVKISGLFLSFRGGISWQLPKSLVLRAGYSSVPSSFAFGAGFASAGLSIDMGFMLNSKTGVTPSVSLLWRQVRK